MNAVLAGLFLAAGFVASLLDALLNRSSRRDDVVVTGSAPRATSYRRPVRRVRSAPEPRANTVRQGEPVDETNGRRPTRAPAAADLNKIRRGRRALLGIMEITDATLVTPRGVEIPLPLLASLDLDDVLDWLGYVDQLG